MTTKFLTKKAQKFVLQCRNISHCSSRRNPNKARFAAGVVVDNKGQFRGFEPSSTGTSPGFFCEECGEEAIAYLPASERPEDNKKKTIGNQIELPVYNHGR